MSSIDFSHDNSDNYVTKIVTTDAQTAEIYGNIPYRVLRVTPADGQVANDGTDTETVTVEVVSGLDLARGDDPTVLDYDGDVTLSIDGVETTKTLSNGSVSFDVTTEKSAGSIIEVVAESLTDPAESDNATIEVTT